MKPIEPTYEEKRAIVKKQFEDFVSSSEIIKTADDLKLIRKAFEIADNVHIKQFRRSGQKLPYIIHPIAVAKIITTEMGMDITTAVSALLHDTIEDSKGKYTVVDVKNDFGKTVAIIVDGVTKIKEQFDKHSSMQVETFKKFIQFMAIDKRTAYVKIADRLHNLRTMEEERDNSKMEKTAEVFDVYAPLAHGLGLFEIKKKIEDLSFKYREENEYNKTYVKAEKFRNERKDYFDGIVNEIKKCFSKNNIKVRIEKKEKSLFRAYEKTKNKKISFTDIHNFISIRIILEENDKFPEKQQAYLAFSHLSDNFPINLKSFKDWITIPKTNGFQALIIDLMYLGRWAEVQIMTERMNDVANVGFSNGYENSHFENMDIWVKSVNEILKKETLSNEEAMDLIHPQDREVFALTPQGERIKLPKYATVLDFAFKIHSDLGIHFRGAEVNGKLVSFDYQIGNNDLVHIIKADKAEPYEEWLYVLKCPHSRNKLKQYLNKRKQKAIVLGKKTYEEVSARFKITEKEFNNLLIKYICANEDELFYRIANNTISEKSIVNSIKDGRGIFSKMTGIWSQGKSEAIDLTHFDPKKNFIITDFSNITIANCCKPVEGDTSIIYRKEPGKFEVHRHECKNAKKLNASYGKQTAKVEWNLTEKNTFPNTIKFTGFENKGILSEMIGIISKENDVNMTSLNIKSEKNKFHGSIDIQVPDVESLNLILKRMRKIKFIKKVYRVVEYQD